MAFDDPLVVAGVTMAGAVLVAAIVAVSLCAWQRRRRTRQRTAQAGAQPQASWLSGLAKTRGSLARRLMDAWGSAGGGEAWLTRVEEILLASDVGVKATQALIEQWRLQAKSVDSPRAVRELLKSTVRGVLADGSLQAGSTEKPQVILVVGVNGVGKTTTIGKLAYRCKQQGQEVLLVAADTFRAAAIEQLALWAARVGADLVKHQPGADPSAVAFDGIRAAIARGVEVVIVDTAGRLHVKTNLMEEVKKIARTTGRQVAGAPHEVLLVIDATTGQNALAQARVFHQALGVTGIALTKLDGTAKGGIVLAIRSELGLPIRYIGLGEGPEDLAPFDPDAFVDALFPTAEMTDAA